MSVQWDQDLPENYNPFFTEADVKFLRSLKVSPNWFTENTRFYEEQEFRALRSQKIRDARIGLAIIAGSVLAVVIGGMYLFNHVWPLVRR
jgi:hypothetical protein